MREEGARRKRSERAEADPENETQPATTTTTADTASKKLMARDETGPKEDRQYMAFLSQGGDRGTDFTA